MITSPLEIAWGVILALWVLYSRLGFICPIFRDPDAARLAFGVAQRLQGVPYSQGVFHQLEKQFGTYVLFEFVARTMGIGPAGLEHFMPIICAVLMIGIIALSFSLGLMIWGRRVALVSTTLLAISPMVWITGEYPTSLVPAMFFFMLAVWAMVMSYRVRGGRWWLVASALLFAWSIVTRLDMSLGMLVPLCYAYFVDRRGLRRAWILYAITAVVLIAAWLLSGIPLVKIIHVGPHNPDYSKSLLLNWWGMGPFLFVFAFAGFIYRFVTDRRPLPFIFFWIVCFNTFYTGHLYSPRYFIPYYPPVAWLAAFSIIALYGWLVRLVRYNRPMRLIFMLLLILGALSTLTVSTIKGGDGRVRLAWGKTISYARDDGLSPTGSMWFFMQNFRHGAGIQSSWVEFGARGTAGKLLRYESDTLHSNGPPIFVGSESQVFLNYFLLAGGCWKFETVRGPFVEFSLQPGPPGAAIAKEGDISRMLQTVYVGDKPLPELGFLSNPGDINVLLGRDAIPRLIRQQGSVGAPMLSDVGGWHVAHSFSGLDILQSSPVAGMSDGTIECERELYRFFHTDALPRMHVRIIQSNDPFADMSGGVVTSHNGSPKEYDSRMYLDRVSELTWISHPQPHRWLALALNRTGLLPAYRVSVNGVPVQNPDFLVRNVAGYGLTRWDILLIPPEYISSPVSEFRLEANLPGSVFDIFWVQRTYPDCQYKNEIARPLRLEFRDLSCIQ